MPSLRQTFLVLCGLLVLTMTAAAQREEQVRDVQKLYHNAAVPGLEITVYLQQANGTLTPVAPEQEFYQGERVKIRLESNFRGYLYIINHGASGTKRLLFPDAKESNLMQPRATYLLPRTYGLIFDEKAGFETLQVIIAPKRIALLDAASKRPDGVLNARQIALAARYWRDATPAAAGIISAAASAPSAAAQDGSRDPAFDRKKKTTTVLVSRPKRRAAFSGDSLGIKLRNAGRRP